MLLKLKTAPTIEPVSLETLKSHLRIEFDDNNEDDYLADLIAGARTYLENYCGPFITQTWEQYEDEWPAGDRLVIGKPRLLTVTSIAYTDEDSVLATFAAASYTADTVNEFSPGIVLKSTYEWPTATLFNVNPIVVTFTCGYGATAATVPLPLRQALLLLCAHWYETRQPINVTFTGNTVTPVPLTIDALVANYRTY